MDKFKLGKKWFWMGAIAALIYPIVGLIYGFMLWFEKKERLRKEAVIVIALAVFFGVTYGLIADWYAHKGYGFPVTGNINKFPITAEGGPKTGDILPK